MGFLQGLRHPAGGARVRRAGGRALVVIVGWLPLAGCAREDAPDVAPDVSLLHAPWTAPVPLPFVQDWSNTSMVIFDGDWSAVPGVVGYLGERDPSLPTGADPQTVLDEPSLTPDVAANLPDATGTTGGVAELELANPTMALRGSATADAPSLVLHLDTTGASSIHVSYTLRDVDASDGDAVQPVALQYRVGDSGAFTNVAEAFVPDATTGPGEASLVTPVSVTLPAEVDDEPLVQLRILTTDAIGADEWVGVDDIVVGAATPPSATGSATPASVLPADETLLRVVVVPGAGPASTGVTVTADLTRIGGAAAQALVDDGTGGDATAGDGVYSYTATVTTLASGTGSLPVTVVDAQGREATTTIALDVWPAPTIVVGGACTLAGAIASANADVPLGGCAAGAPGPDTIQVPAGVFVFTEPGSESDPYTTLPYITTPMAIVGAGAEQTILRRDPAAPPFRFLSIENQAQVLLAALAFEGGKIPGTTYGSAVQGRGGELTVNDCRFSGNDAGTGVGGAIGMDDPFDIDSGIPLVVRRSSFTGNLGHNAAIYQPRGATLVTASTFSGNTGPTTAAVAGIVMIHAHDDLHIEGCTFEDNVSQGAFHVRVAKQSFYPVPGAIVVRQSQFRRNSGGSSVLHLFRVDDGPSASYLVDDCVFEDNETSAIDVYGGLTRVARSTFRGNTATRGAAIALNARGFPITVDACTFEDNVASVRGGAIYVGGGGQVVVEDSTFTGNHAASPADGAGGGAVALVAGHAEIRRSRFASNSAEPDVLFVYTPVNATESGTVGRLTMALEGSGGAIWAPNSTPYTWRVVDSCFVGNTRTAVTGKIDASGNWWGAADGPVGPTTPTGTGAGDTRGGQTTTAGFLTIPPEACVGMTPLLPPISVALNVTGTATPEVDYAALASPVLVTQHTGLLPFSIVAVNDALDEPDETVIVAAAPGAGYRPYASGTVTIVDDGTGTGGCPPSCDDGVACTTDACVDGSCTHTPVHASCNDAKACTVDTCDPTTGCANTPSAALCDDGVACTADACNATTGACSHTPVHTSCDDLKACTVDTCDPTTGCASTPSAALCNDGVACTTDACDGATGACSHTPVHTSCNDGKPCSTDTCSVTLGCLHAPDDAACDDGLACTVDDCDGGTLTCTYTTIDAACNDDNVCTTDTCVAGVGCTNPPRVGVCDDLDPCTSGSSCIDGACGGGVTIPGCEVKSVDLGAPFGTVDLPVPAGDDLCFSGTKQLAGCAPLGACELRVEACFYPNDTVVDVAIDTSLGLVRDAQATAVELAGRWVLGGWCAVGALPDLTEGPITVEAGMLIACWNGAGEGFLAAQGRARSTPDLELSAIAVDGTLTTTPGPHGVPLVGGCMGGELSAGVAFPGLPGALSATARLRVCFEQGSRLELPQWWPFPDDPETVARDVVGHFVQDPLTLGWSVRIDHALDPALDFCRFLLKAGKIVGQRVGARWLLTLGGVASFDFAGQHVEAGVSAVIDGATVSLSLTSSAELSLYLKHGDPEEDGILLQAKKRLGVGARLALRAPALPTMRLSCTAPETTVDIYGTVSMPFCDDALTASVTLSGSLGEPGFRMQGTASLVGGIGLPVPLALPGLPPMPGPYCLGLASEPRLEWNVCGKPAPPEGGLWLHTTADLALFGGDPVEVELRVGVDPPETAGAYATLLAPVELIGPEDHAPGITSLSLGEAEIALHLEACDVEGSGLSFATAATMVRANGATATYTAAVEASLVRTSVRLTSTTRWLDAYGIVGLGLESGSTLALTIGLADPPQPMRFGVRETWFFKTGGAWPDTVAAGGEVCDELPARDDDGDGLVSCADPQCANHLMCRARVVGGNIVALRGALYFDLASKPGLFGIRIPGLAARFDVGASILIEPPDLAPPPVPAPSASEVFVGASEVVRDSGAAAERALTWLADDVLTDGKRKWMSMLQAILTNLRGTLATVRGEDAAGDAAALDLDVALPDLCDRVSVACPPGAISVAPAPFEVDAVSVSFATRDVAFDDMRFAAGLHAVVTTTTPNYTRRIEGSLGGDPPGLSLAGSIVGTPGSLVTLFDITLPGVGPLMRVALSGDPYDRVARWPDGSGGYLRAGPSLRLDFAREGTVEGIVTRASWGTDPFAALFAARYGLVGATPRGWKIGIGDGDGTSWGRLTFESTTPTGVVTRAHTLLPVVPPGRRTHVAVTWSTVTVDGREVLDVAFLVDGQRQASLTSPGGVLVPGVASGRQLIVGAGLETLDELRLWSEPRSAARIASEAELLAADSAADTGLVVRYDFDRDLGAAATNRGNAGSALTGLFVSGGATAPEVNSPVVIARLVTGGAGAAAGLHALAGFTLTTPAGAAPFRLEARAHAGAVTGSLFAQEVPLVPLGAYGTLCLRDVTGTADLTQDDTNAQATLALCRADGNRTLGTFGVRIRCPAGQICPPGLVLGVDGPLGGATLTLPGDLRIFLAGHVKADTASGEVVVTGRLGFGAFTFDGVTRWSRDRLAVDTVVDLEPFVPGGPDPGPATLRLVHDLAADTMCGTGQATVSGGVPCTVDVCFQGGSGGGITGTLNCAFPTAQCTTSSQCASDETCIAGACLPKLVNGAPCTSAGQCQSGNCAGICYAPDSLLANAFCTPASPDPCAGDLVCTARPCPPCSGPACLPCPSPTCLPMVAPGMLCVGDAQCPSGTTCRRASNAPLLFTKYCLWPDETRTLGQQCGSNAECTSDLCLPNVCVCNDDLDCGAGKLCVAGACVSPPPPSRLPGQSCTTDAECTLLDCVDGTCGCKVSSDCGSTSKYCLNPSLGTLPVGKCLSRLEDGALCASDDMCLGGYCDRTLGPTRCYTPGRAGLGAVCLDNRHCATGRCQLACNWSGSCSPLDAFEDYLGSGQPSQGCTCSTTCACSADSHCGASRYCGALTFMGVPVPGQTMCKDKLTTDQVCSRDGECRNGDCYYSSVCVGTLCAGANKCN